MAVSSRRSLQAVTACVLAHADALRRIVIVAGVLGIGTLLVFALRSFWHGLRYDDIVAAMEATPGVRIALAVLATAVSFAALVGYDASALRYVGARVPPRTIAKTAFVGYALSNTIGLGVFTGGAVRMRLYGAAGVEPAAVSRAIVFNALVFGLGACAVGGAGLWWDAAALAPLLYLPAWAVAICGASAMGAVLVVLALCHVRDRIGRLRLPSPRLAWTQLALSVLDITAAAAVLWLLLPEGAVGFATFLGFYAAAVVIGVISHVPGGLGVFEAVMLVALGSSVPAGELAGALVLYRLVYYVLPLVIALGVLIAHETGQLATPARRFLSGLAPRVLAAATLVAAVMLLVSGATPATGRALQALQVLPLPLVEAAHFLSSIIGVLLLFVARALLRRLDAAWWAAVVLVALALLFALPKGLALTEAVVLSALLLALLASRRSFKRRASLLAVPFTGGWLLAMAVICVAVTGLLFFAYRDVAYGHQLWWQFAVSGEAPRSLRAMVAVAVVALVLALRQLVRPGMPAPPLPDAAQLARAQAILRMQSQADAGLVLTGDKHLLFSEAGDAFLMYGRQGRSWIALFDPVGPRESWPELVWRFLEHARDAGARGCFYQVGQDALPLYLDAGLRLFKLGEYASVPLKGFSLQGKRRGNLRTAVNRAEREGLTFAIIDAVDVPAALPAMRAVSDAWLGEHRAAEKRFSIGAFDPAYIARNPVAVVGDGERIIAFASLLVAGDPATGEAEASIDLMRHLPDAPPGTMDFLFARVLQYLSDAGYVQFGLGMAPLSGMAAHALAPNWHRMGRLLFARGEHFYNFRGLRAFKDKFDPQWNARYLATPGGVAPLLVLADAAALIAGGYRGVLSK
ncbi:bifunctional lysylphosphatidylglycerol flippase/synthetase MprF [Luteimonas terrae]|uniref:Phosphatidylglycerol lysyltransferase n=1 Tax=Luteimonas terrae TaxID=1530191 RepID=A0ABU1XW84_9GAMM|nr:bifunctional lysylphosphatidylglycerol flippase/synthetase MprF [Luteimonas terrae]MDR7193024.1 phosphatidylglycerol lysyltransferase [Luteimonas terrae]